MPRNAIHIIGAGPAGLSAALYLAQKGENPVVFEQASDVGHRFIGDFQGLENWSTEQDATQVLRSAGIDLNFRCVPYTDGTIFGPGGEPHPLRPSRPLFYLVERGNRESSLDSGLKRQVLAAGIEIRFGQRVEVAGADKVIVATGPRAPSAIARGIVFSCSLPDGYFCFLDERIAPRGYAYLLVNDGRATLATCLFDDFKHATDYFRRAVETIRTAVPMDIRDPRPFGGYVNFGLRGPRVKNDRIYFVGERAGFQDALWGFGLRYAIRSGMLAAQAIVGNEDYEALCETEILPGMRTGYSNRLIHSQLGNHGYEWTLGRLQDLDVIAKLGDHYSPSAPKRILFEIAKRRLESRFGNPECDQEECACVACRHGRDVDLSAMERCLTPFRSPTADRV